ncbi:UDP-4-amino-4,6-dideoxy-N-acetyl-beta-L-altrosamine transaminase [Oceanibacterium hippocampi]|uniref:UDP-4-amino-4-deoxy-L-arabinose--oxoglutarate aminotransferase n=1 Tax=Oceanibacterium hippocampi TaxID=745714 RepID=A0A1Y5SD78_9PROT|nr:UDP-4-amino-4,6-dideoxy-N-acetyl-beta-L-altrosamine transaminase [Oceanibacterium hippocampi]SLN38090.1 UDP-4-amino-4-deoxy-L-arabinose--oxoglutarate aminotransferase [Oceanibacterium hippocampi]
MDAGPNPPFLPYGRQEIDDDDIAAVARVLKSDWLTTGPAVQNFESALARATGARYALACSSGTAALHLAAMALGLGPGDAVIVPAITFLATANAVRYTGAEVVFADVDPSTGLMEPSDLEAALARVPDGLRARAVFNVHYAGQTGDVWGIAAVARANGLRIVEDAAHALGTRYGGDHAAGACAHADMACFSFHPVKTVAMGEGGAVTTNDPTVAAAVMRFRNHGMSRNPDDFGDDEIALDAAGNANPWIYAMPEPGYNYRASDIACALGASQLAKLDGFVRKRRQLIALYDRALDELPKTLRPLIRPLERRADSRPAWHLSVVLIDFPRLGLDRAALMHILRAQGIGSQVHYIPVHRQPYYRARYDRTVLRGADAFYARCLSLPLYPSLSARDIGRVIAAFQRL